MGGYMCKIIFSKASNERIDRFRIITSILEDNEGNRYVYKRPLSTEANDHIARIKLNYFLLSNMYDNSVFKINKILSENNGICFEYIKGENLLRIINDLYIKKGWSGIKGIVGTYAKALRGMANSKFKITKKFLDVFGEVSFDKEQKTCTVSNIDMIFTNIVIKDGKWNVIDYEWVFTFPVPVDYILYRAILATVFDDKKRIMNELDITNNDIKNYEAMENSFQSFVSGKEIILEKYLKNIYSVRELRDITLGDKVKINELDKRNSYLENEVLMLSQKLDSKEKELLMLSQKLDTIYSSRGMKLLQTYYKLRDRLLK